MTKKYLKIALAYVGVIVGAGLSSGQDLMQYFVSFGKEGIIGVLILAALNIIFGRIIVTLGCYYGSNNHQEVLEKITHPFINKIIDYTLIVSSFIIYFVMIAGAGANLHQQFGIPSFIGALICSALVIVVSFMDFNKITAVLGIFTPIIIIMILVITAYTYIGHSYDFTKLSKVAETLESPMPNVVFSAINYYSLCAITGVSMALVLGGSVVRIGVAEKGGIIGGALIGVIVLCAFASLFANVDMIKDSEIPMLNIVANINPIFAKIYTFTIFALIFNTAFSLSFALAKRFASEDKKKLHIILICIVIAGYICSFAGFKKLISLMYPLLGYIGIVLLLVLLTTWIRKKQHIYREKIIRRKMISVEAKKYDDNEEYTLKDKKLFTKLGEQSVVDTEDIKQEIKDVVREESSKNDDE
ncbi:MAG: hypothetical protein K5986_06220 [Clostridium sp.]|uniref:YkvI family membrane protein n=1 Tax=Clostridium sp. DSM 8431 TaxID=1761781 RepID=UPI0008DFFFA5|nr:hypothetical protein [Clostridium sp. DSM 8431]MCR4944040.1 hypothetical protein [Clostridium sp.]SFU34412.1 Uncharacterized membrane protein YkvI [Clostridium sp. DSM 8431]